MISFRYHVVSLLAALLALAAGIAVGSGPLQRTDAAAASDSEQAEALASAQSSLEQARADAAFDEAYAGATASAVLARRLRGRAVTLVALPGAPDGTRDRLAELVDQAGGSVTARVVLGRKLLDVANRQLVTELATQMQASASGVRVPSGATGYERIGALLASATVSDDPDGSPPDDAANSILAGLSTAKLVTEATDVEGRGSLALVVSGPPYGSADDREGAGSIVGSLLAELDEQSGGAVLAGPAAAAGKDGLIGMLRSDAAVAEVVSTVDVVDRAAGQVAGVLALAREADGDTGHYGSEGSADGPVPPT